MTERIKRMKKDVLDNYYHIPICAEKMRYCVEALKKNEGCSDMVKNTAALVNYLDHMTIYVDDNQLLCGNFAAKPHGVEYQPFAELWPDDDLDTILKDGFEIDPEDRAYLRSCDSFLKDTGRCYTAKECMYYDEETDRLWNFRKRGMNTPAFTDRKVGFSGYTMGVGWHMHNPIGLYSPDFSMHLYTGFNKFIKDCDEARINMRFRKYEDLDRYEGLDSMAKALKAVVRLYERYAKLCEEKAAACTDDKRKAELTEMARICRKVPAEGAETFWEGVQAITVYWLIFAEAGQPLERLDQLLYPLYKKDLEEGKITKEQAIEILQCLMLHVADYQFITGMPTQREKYAGRARWNVIIVGGCDPKTGKDATNDLSYIILEASRQLYMPHPTITVRVGEDTPKALMLDALKTVSMGLGYPAFISEKAYIDYIIEHTHGEMTVEEARTFVCNGCVDTGVPGKSRQTGVPMLPLPIIVEFAIDGGEDKMMNLPIGLKTKTLSECTSYEEFYNDCFKPQLDHMVDYCIDCALIRAGAYRQHCQDPFVCAFYDGAIETGVDPFWRKMKYEPSLGVNPVGMGTTIDSLAAIKYLCFDEKVCTPAELHAALTADWVGYEDLREKALKAPKYGNDIEWVDEIGVGVWDDLRLSARRYKGPYDNEICMSAVSITTHGPAGKLTGATPDGRKAFSVLSDASVSPVQGMDKSGPTAMIKSAMKMGHHYSSTLHNIKFSKAALASEEDRSKFADLLKVYLTKGGHQCQINVVDKATLEDAVEHPENHQELIVRVAGYSTYFTNLNKVMQGDVINRTANSTPV